MSDRADFANGLRELADFLEQHEDAPLPKYPTLTAGVDKKEELAAVARAMGTADKYPSYSVFYVSRKFGPVKYAVFTGREEVCRKVVKGRKWLAETPPTPGEWVEDVEWVCDDPLLAPSESPSTPSVREE